MNNSYITYALVFSLGFLTALPAYLNAEEGGITTVKVESEVVSLPSGNTVSATSTCPAGKTLISGGGVCLGFLGTENKVLLTVSAPSPDANNAWFAVCANTDNNPGQAQAMSWALCAESGVFEPDMKK